MAECRARLGRSFSHHFHLRSLKLSDLGIWVCSKMVYPQVTVVPSSPMNSWMVSTTEPCLHDVSVMSPCLVSMMSPCLAMSGHVWSRHQRVLMAEMKAPAWLRCAMTWQLMTEPVQLGTRRIQWMEVCQSWPFLNLRSENGRFSWEKGKFKFTFLFSVFSIMQHFCLQTLVILSII